ncbi:hypothetical protein S40293_10333 [Stachybotrys chartarum IBT 40293]|nr:hypothetical protein S40293_10333 [Stachybotrys chartarum IBT 40293]
MQPLPQDPEAPRLSDALSNSQSPSGSPTDATIDTSKYPSPVQDLQEVDRNPGTTTATHRSTVEAPQSRTFSTPTDSVASKPVSNKDSVKPVEQPSSEQHDTPWASLPHLESTARAALRGLCGARESEPTPTTSRQSLPDEMVCRSTIFLPRPVSQSSPIGSHTPNIAQYSIDRVHRSIPVPRIQLVPQDKTTTGQQMTNANDLRRTFSSQSRCEPLEGLPTPAELCSTTKCRLPPILFRPPETSPSTSFISTSVRSEESPISLVIGQLRDGQFDTYTSPSVSDSGDPTIVGPVQCSASIPPATHVPHMKIRIPRRITTSWKNTQTATSMRQELLASRTVKAFTSAHYAPR